MQPGECETLLLRLDQGVLYVTLNRPESRNAMSLTMVKELRATFREIKGNREVRAVVIRGSAGTFCSGGDIKDMAIIKQQSKKEGEDPYFELNREFGHMLSEVNLAPQAVITLLEGVALGGGFGLACVSDIAVAHKHCRFALPETGLGLVPAQIAPFVVQRIGLTQARRLAVLGARIDGREAQELGLVHHVCESEEEMQEQLMTLLKRIRRCAPEANAVTKKIMLAVGTMDLDFLLDKAAKDFSACLQGEEGREGTRAFIEKRLPIWAENKNG